MATSRMRGVGWQLWALRGMRLKEEGEEEEDEIGKGEGLKRCEEA